MPSKSVTAPVPASAPQQSVYRSLTRSLQDALSDRIVCSAVPKLALLIRWSEAEANVDRTCDEPNLDRNAWDAIEDLCRDVLRDIETVLRESEVQTSGFVTLSDAEKGGVQ